MNYNCGGCIWQQKPVNIWAICRDIFCIGSTKSEANYIAVIIKYWNKDKVQSTAQGLKLHFINCEIAAWGKIIPFQHQFVSKFSHRAFIFTFSIIMIKPVYECFHLTKSNVPELIYSRQWNLFTMLICSAVSLPIR